MMKIQFSTNDYIAELFPRQHISRDISSVGKRRMLNEFKQDLFQSSKKPNKNNTKTFTWSFFIRYSLVYFLVFFCFWNIILYITVNIYRITYVTQYKIKIKIHCPLVILLIDLNKLRSAFIVYLFISSIFQMPFYAR